jgi:phosphate transport system ATP-binding protein
MPVSDVIDLTDGANPRGYVYPQTSEQPQTQAYAYPAASTNPPAYAYPVGAAAAPAYAYPPVNGQPVASPPPHAYQYPRADYPVANSYAQVSAHPQAAPPYAPDQYLPADQYGYVDQLVDPVLPVAPATSMDARSVSAWFGSHKVLDRVSLHMPAGTVTALIGPSGCGKSTFLRILNRMHELIPSASLAGEVLLDGEDIYDAERRVTETRKRIGMVFQKPNPFPAMTIGDNVVAGLKLNGMRVSRTEREELIEECLIRGGLWNEVKDRLDRPGGALSGGQQQRLCIARSLAVRPEVLLMDEPCSALDPTSTRRVEETIAALASEVTIVIVTHNMQQAARVSQQCAFFLAEQGTPGFIVESGETSQIFNEPQDPRTSDYVNGRFG